MVQIFSGKKYIKFIFTLFISFLLIGIVSCSKKEAKDTQSELPPITHEGKNTFGCKVNGEIWVAYAPFKVGGHVALDGYYYSQSKSLQLTATRDLDDLNKLETIRISLENLTSAGEYQMRASHLLSRGFTDYTGSYYCAEYFYDTTILHNVNVITFSTEHGIVSGTFEMDLVNPSCPGDTLRIREGRFDWRMAVWHG